MTGSNFGNFYNGALKDFEAKQASRIVPRATFLRMFNTTTPITVSHFGGFYNGAL